MMNETVILLSHFLCPKTPTYGNRDKLVVEQTSKISEGSSANSSQWIFSTNHMGTHIDMPNHFFEKGMTVTDYPASFWFCNNPQLLDIPMTEAGLINVAHLSGKVKSETDILLIRTNYESYRESEKYWDDNPGISAEVGIWIREKFPTIKIIGFDFISLTSWKFRNEGKRAHMAFLDPQKEGSSICIIEDMSLKNINVPLQKIIIAPLFIKSTNGAPVTVYGIINK